MQNLLGEDSRHVTHNMLFVLRNGNDSVLLLYLHNVHFVNSLQT